MDMLFYMEERANHLECKRKTILGYLCRASIPQESSQEDRVTVRVRMMMETDVSDGVKMVDVEQWKRGHGLQRQGSSWYSPLEPLEGRPRVLTLWTYFIFLASRTLWLCLG